MDIPRPNRQEQRWKKICGIFFLCAFIALTVIAISNLKPSKKLSQERQTDRYHSQESVILDPPIKLDQEYTVITPTSKDPFIIHQGTMHGDVLYALMTNGKWVVVTPPFILVQQ